MLVCVVVECDVDFIVMGMYGCCGVCCVLFGSVVELLVCVVDWLVLVVWEGLGVCVGML